MISIDLRSHKFDLTVKPQLTFVLWNTAQILACYSEGALTEGDDCDFWETWRSNQVCPTQHIVSIYGQV